MVRPCTAGGAGLGAVGTWEEITPTVLNSAKWCTPKWNDTCPGPEETNSAGLLGTYGALAVVIDPTDTANVTVGTSSLGIWKTSDCGSTWAHINTGTNGVALDKGRNWTMVMDPSNPKVIYTCAGYGESGVYKTTDGGVNWQQMLTADVQQYLPQKGFVEKITLEPKHPQHVLVSFHGPCTGANGSYGCLAESTNGGTSWTLIKSAESWTEGDGQTMVDAKTWFFGSSFGGIWRTTDAGANWTMVFQGKASGDVYVSPKGSFFAAGQASVLHSADGVSWSPLANSPGGVSINGSSAVIGNGETLFASNGNGGNQPADGWYWSAPESTPTAWTSMHGPKQKLGASYLAYDPDHHLLYSGNLVGGFWRVVTQ